MYSHTIKRNFKRHIPVVVIVSLISVFFLGVSYAVAKDKAYGYLKTILLWEVNDCKQWVEDSFMMIHLTFNSGRSEISIQREFLKTVQNIFYIDFFKPSTMVSAQTAYILLFRNLAMDRLLHHRNQLDSQHDFSKLFGQDSSSIKSAEENTDTTPNYKLQYGSVLVNSEISNLPSMDQLLNEPLKIHFDTRGPKILLVHTHTTEGYLRDLEQFANPKIPIRSEDTSRNVVGVGKEITHQLNNTWGIHTIHNSTNHIKGTDIGSYARSLNTVEKILQSYPSIGVVLDIHRDGIGGGKKLRIIQTYKNKTYAKIMVVLGTNGSGLDHPNWKENYKFSIHLQRELQKIVPGITRPIYISKNRYNQHVRNGALIIEIGGDGNLMKETLESAKVLAQAIHLVFEKTSKTNETQYVQ